MKKVDAMKILNLRMDTINNCIKTKKIEIDLTGKIIDDSVYSFLKELEERRKQELPKWIHRNEF